MLARIMHETNSCKRSQAGVWLIFRRAFARSVLDVIAEKCA